MKKYYGNYLGIVVSSGNDPENRNRVQIWVPHITNTLYDGWNNKDMDSDFFNFSTGNNIPDENLLNRIRKVLPWAECASPIFGGGSPVVYNDATRKTSPDAAETLLQYGEEPLPSTGEESLPSSDEYEENLPSVDIPLPSLLPESQETVTPIQAMPPEGPTIPDTPANNVPGSGSGLPPVEPDLPI